MKRIFRYTNVGLLAAALLALGAVSGFAQDNCADAAGQTALSDKVRAIFAEKGVDPLKSRIAMSKEFLEKYGACESAKEFADYLKPNVPKWETSLKNMQDAAAKAALLTRFNAGLTSKNWDEVYAAGKEILQKYPDEFRTAVLVLGSIGLDETAKATPITKYNDDTLRFAKQAIADLEASKDFGKTFGVAPFVYTSKDDALGWMNYTIGYLYFFDKKDKKQGLSYIYKATQANSTTKNNPILYAAIGSFYFDEVRKLAAEVTALEKSQDPNATPEAQKALVDQIKAKVALVNGTAENAIDAYARAQAFAKADPAKYKKEYVDSLTKNMQDLYNVRFGKMDGFDTFVSNLVKKPMPNPMNPVTPISDPEPTTTSTSTTGTNLGVPSGTGIGAANGTGVGAANGKGLGTPNGASAAKPVAAKPAGPIKPQK